MNLFTYLDDQRGQRCRRTSLGITRDRDEELLGGCRRPAAQPAAPTTRPRRGSSAMPRGQGRHGRRRRRAIRRGSQRREPRKAAPSVATTPTRSLAQRSRLRRVRWRARLRRVGGANGQEVLATTIGLRPSGDDRLAEDSGPAREGRARQLEQDRGRRRPLGDQRSIRFGVPEYDPGKLSLHLDEEKVNVTGVAAVASSAT